MAHPLLCWDIVMEGTVRRIEFAKDITALQNLMKVNSWHSLIMPMSVFRKKIPCIEPHTAVVWCSPQRSGPGCADGLVAEQTPTTRRESATENKYNFIYFREW